MTHRARLQGPRRNRVSNSAYEAALVPSPLPRYSSVHSEPCPRCGGSVWWDGWEYKCSMCCRPLLTQREWALRVLDQTPASNSGSFSRSHEHLPVL